MQLQDLQTFRWNYQVLTYLGNYYQSSTLLLASYVCNGTSLQDTDRNQRDRLGVLRARTCFLDAHTTLG